MICLKALSDSLTRVSMWKSESYFSAYFYVYVYVFFIIFRNKILFGFRWFEHSPDSLLIIRIDISSSRGLCGREPPRCRIS